MANYFIAGVGYAQLFKGEELFADCHTLADSSITIGVTAEELRGGEGNALWGKYFHDSSFSMKLTDIMFNMSYVAANVGANIEKGGDIFANHELTANESGEITLPSIAVPLKSGSATFAYIRKADAADDKRTKVSVTEDNKIVGLDANTTYCVRYFYTDASADKLVVSSQFIPDTLYAILTVALYAGDDKNPENGTKVGEVVIKIPRFQLSGAMDISMTASGTSQTALEGSALASGASGCEGKGIYAEIVQVIYNSHWYDDASGLIIEDNYIEEKATNYKVGSAPVVYAWYPTSAPKQISNAILTAQESALAENEKTKLIYSIEGGTGLSIDASTGVISGTPSAGTSTIKVVAQKAGGTAIPGMDASATIVLK